MHIIWLSKETVLLPHDGKVHIRNSWKRLPEYEKKEKWICYCDEQIISEAVLNHNKIENVTIDLRAQLYNHPARI
jgi:hypothetical protein